MDDATRHALLQILGNAMSDISEDSYCAGWLGGAEYCVPELCRRALASGEPQFWGHGEVTPDQARGLMALAEIVGSWANLDEAMTGYVPFQPFPVPELYVQGIEADQSSEFAQRRRAM
jgi:hypothetical protein